MPQHSAPSTPAEVSTFEKVAVGVAVVVLVLLGLQSLFSAFFFLPAAFFVGIWRRQAISQIFRPFEKEDGNTDDGDDEDEDKDNKPTTGQSAKNSSASGDKPSTPVLDTTTGLELGRQLKLSGPELKRFAEAFVLFLSDPQPLVTHMQTLTAWQQTQVTNYILTLLERINPMFAPHDDSSTHHDSSNGSDSAWQSSDDNAGPGNTSDYCRIEPAAQTQSFVPPGTTSSRVPSTEGVTPWKPSGNSASGDKPTDTN